MKTFSTIGTSWITESFIKAAHQTGKAELSSVYSRSENTAKKFARKNGSTNWYTDLEEMLKEDTDFIYIASPNTFHYEHMVKAIKKKKHVFCEKPMFITEQEWKDIDELAEREGVFVFEGYRHLYSPNYERLKGALNDIGKIRSGILQYVQYSSRYDAFMEGKNPNVFSKGFAGGALMDLGVYPLSMAIDLFGEPVKLDYFPVKLSNGIDGSGTLVLSYENYVITILCSKIAQGFIPSEFHGEEGTVTIDHIAPISKITHFDRENNEKHELAKEQLELDMVYETDEFIRMISENDKDSYKKAMERSRQVVKCLEYINNN
ncbi:Gfo/Idh/MocA family protein [Oceanobacillus halophilus]|uniref:Gfo/Idh/MocA family oxidoreductase n=1 Tax=Oceanobacillus halophilus TaxID=930130 RepID=A0A495A251_9BACI|nr:Gfo/Idh/MocA family oxidoreductase [Oceanobacillus halophilus]RKQ33162.1 gfo/Idh/MocA family oxidoreductase [Oceanobacillus halophilus]